MEIMSAVFLAACAALGAPPDDFGQNVAPESAEPVVIEMAMVGASEATDYLIEEIERYNNVQSGVRITYYALQFPRREDTPLHTIPRIGQNILGLSSEAGTEPYYLVSRDLLVPVEKFLPDPEFPDDLFYDNLWDAVTYKGKRWGVPLLCNAYALFCDWPQFEAAGIAEPPKTWDEFLHNAELLSSIAPEGNDPPCVGANFGFQSRFGESVTYLWKSMVLQKGGHFVKDGRFELSHSALRESYDFIERMRKSSAIHEDGRLYTQTLQDNKQRYAMQIQPTYRIKHLKGETDFRIAPMPTFGKEVQLDEKRFYLAIRRSTPEKETASWEFIKWLCRQDSPYNRTVASRFTFPCMRPLVDRMEISTQFDNYPIDAKFVHYGKSWPVQWHNLEADSPKAKNHFNEIVDALFAGKLEFEEAMQKAQQECNAILAAGEGEVEPYALYK